MSGDSRLFEKNIPKIYLFQIFKNAIVLAIPTVVLFWQDNGLSFVQIMVLQALFAAAVILLEVPTGYLADVAGRRLSMILSGGAMILAATVYGLGHNFAQFLIAEILIASSLALASGADSAIVYDSLKEVKREEEFKKIWGRCTWWMMASSAFFGLIGSFFAGISLRTPFFVAAIVSIVLIPIALSLYEPHHYRRVFKRNYLVEILETARTALVKNKELRRLIVFSAFIHFILQSAFWLYQPYIKAAGVDIVYFGAIFAAINIFAALVSNFTHAFERKLKPIYWLILMPVLVGGSYILMGLFVYAASVLLILAQQAVRGFSRVIFEDSINRLTDSERRATTLSLHSMAQRLPYALLLPLVGWATDVYGIAEAFIAMGVVGLAVGGALALTFFGGRFWLKPLVARVQDGF